MISVLLNELTVKYVKKKTSQMHLHTNSNVGHYCCQLQFLKMSITPPGFLLLLLSLLFLYIISYYFNYVIVLLPNKVQSLSSGCTRCWNNSPTASDVEAVDVDLKPAYTTSPAHSYNAFNPILFVGSKRNPSGHTLCKTTQLGHSHRSWLYLS